jgi:ribonuclease H2 subunit A
MIYACAYCPVEKQEAYRKRGYRDSKDVKPAERDRLFAALLEDPDVGFRSRIVSAEEISNANYSHTENRNLNEVSYDAATGLNRDVLATGINLAELYVDALGNCATYRATLQRLFPGICTIVVESKADVNYPIVSVASIVAKTLRDGITENLPFKECDITIDRNYGNGYPSTPAVKDWLMRNPNTGSRVRIAVGGAIQLGPGQEGARGSQERREAGDMGAHHGHAGTQEQDADQDEIHI